MKLSEIKDLAQEAKKQSLLASKQKKNTMSKMNEVIILDFKCN